VDSIGDTLRRERLRRGLKLEQVSAETKIGSHYLQAMEENRFDSLPSGLFTRSFLRQYTHTLGLDEKEVVASLEKQSPEAPVVLPEPQGFKPPPYLPHLPMLAWLALVLAGCGFVYKLWENGPRNSHESSVMTPRGRSESLKANASRMVMAPLRTESRSAEEPAVARADARESGSRPVVAAMRVMLVASEPVWVSIKSDGVPAYSGTLEGQQSREFDASGKMTVLVGNAGGLTISVNGAQVALRGAHGEVKLLELTPKGAQVVPRTPPGPPTPLDRSDLAGQNERPT
jgi:cytoskeletal protein RodZ